MKRILPALPYLVLALSLTSTLLFWNLYDAGLRERAFLIYQDRTAEIVSRVIGRMRDIEAVLRGGAGLWNASNTVNRDEWRRYVATLRLGENFPGIQGVGFSLWLAPAEKEEHVRAIRAEGFPEYNIRPAGDRPVYTSILYLEPFDWRNQRAFGYDMFSEPVRRAAMDQAKDSGETHIAAPVILVQETEREVQNGMLMYVPIYRQGLPTETVAERRQALLGFAYSPFRIKDFMDRALGQMPADIALDLYAADREQADDLLFASLQAEGIGLPPDFAPHHQSRIAVEAYGRTWVFRFKTLPAFAQAMSAGPSHAILAGGLLVSLLLAAIAFILLAGWRRVLANAQAMAESEARFKGAFEHAAIGMALVSPAGAWLKVNPSLCAMLGYAEEELLAMTFQEVTHPDDLASDLSQSHRLLAGEIDSFVMEKRFFRKTAEVIWGRIAISLVRDGGGTPLYFVAQTENIDERKRAEEALVVAREQAEAGKRAKALFLANMSHEVRTPLNAIQGFAQILGRDPELNPSQRASLATIVRNGDHLLGLISNILAIARDEGDQMTRPPTPADLAAGLADGDPWIRPRAGDGGRSQAGDVPTAPPAPPAPPDADLAARLAALPDDWRAELRAAVALGDFGRITAALEALPTHDAGLHQVLARWAYDYDLEAFTALCDRAEALANQARDPRSDGAVPAAPDHRPDACQEVSGP